MAGNCGTCGEPCVVSTETVKCAGNCDILFHLKCVPVDTKTRSAKKDFVCDRCKKDRPKSTSSLGSSKAVQGTALTKEFLVNMMEAFKSEMFKEFKNHREEFDEFKKALSFFSEKLDGTNKLLEESNRNYKEMKKEVEQLRLEKARMAQDMKEMQVRIRNMEQYSRKNNIEVAGLPVSSNEDVVAVVEDVGKAIGVPLRREELAAAHRVPSFRAGRTPPLIIQFSTRITRDLWISKAKEQRNLTADKVNRNFPQRRVFIGEHLTPETKVLLARSKDKCREIGWKYVWCREGKVFVRKCDGEKCLKIDSVEDLAKLK